VSKASSDKVYAERAPMMPQSNLFSPASPRTAFDKLTREESRLKDGGADNEGDDIEIPAFIRKKMT
ncbi:MAG: hypothetical protein AAB855_00275, partial [Patescibacteria group bacterium]